MMDHVNSEDRREFFDGNNFILIDKFSTVIYKSSNTSP